MMEKAAYPAADNSGKTRPLLARYFPLIRTREEIFSSISRNPVLYQMFSQWDRQYQEDFMERCTGEKGIKVLYDGIFKEIFNPEIVPERLSELLSLLLSRNVFIKAVLPNDSVRLGSESSLLYTDIIVELEDGSLANIEIQKIGYAFPGERCACYSADHLLRQYKRVRGKRGENFNYRNIKRVYTIVFFEKSPSAFWKFPENWLHCFRQQSNTGLVIELLQEYLFIPLDIFRKSMENKTIDTLLEAWLAFLSSTVPTRIEELITRYPQFKAMYQNIYELCLNTEKVMNVYSKELEILDRNTVLYMIDEMQIQIDQKKAELDQIKEKLTQKSQKLEQQDKELEQKSQKLEQQNQKLEQQNQKLEQQNQKLEQQNQKLEQQKQEIQALKASLAVFQAAQGHAGKLDNRLN